VHRFGHWGPGWFEIILIDPRDSDRVAVGEDIERSLSDYPALDDEDLSRREHEDFQEAWECWGCSEFRRFLVREFDLGDAVESFLEDVDGSELLEFYFDHASEPYHCESSGVSMTFSSGNLNRHDVAEFLWKQRLTLREEVA
jgi:hypothetical protein